MHLPRWIHKAYARLMGYFWLACPVCGEFFGGHEHNNYVAYEEEGDYGRGRVVCPRHIRDFGPHEILYNRDGTHVTRGEPFLDRPKGDCPRDTEGCMFADCSPAPGKSCYGSNAPRHVDMSGGHMDVLD